MGRWTALLLVGCLWPGQAMAQMGPDEAARERLRWAHPDPRLEWLSAGLVAAALAAACVQDRTWRCVANEGLQVGAGLVTAEVGKRLVKRPRPPGATATGFSWPSEHTLLGCVAIIRTKFFALCPAIGYTRLGLDDHWLTDVLSGGGAAALLTTIRWGD